MTAIIVGELHETDRARWGELWRLYLEFYRTTLPDSAYNLLWQRIRSGRGPVWGLGARFAGNGMPLVGITHFLFHDHGWSAKPVCYLQSRSRAAAATRSISALPAPCPRAAHAPSGSGIARPPSATRHLSRHLR
jgi:hypothetical protein